MTQDATITEDREAVQCRGKHRFESRSVAREVAQRGRSQKNDNRNAYQCRFCRGWHIGTELRPKHRRSHRAGD